MRMRFQGQTPSQAAGARTSDYAILRANPDRVPSLSPGRLHVANRLQSRMCSPSVVWSRAWKRGRRFGFRCRRWRRRPRIPCVAARHGRHELVASDGWESAQRQSARGWLGRIPEKGGFLMDQPVFESEGHRNARKEVSTKSSSTAGADRPMVSRLSTFSALRLDVFASRKSRGDKTAIELFLIGVRALRLRWRIVGISPAS